MSKPNRVALEILLTSSLSLNFNVACNIYSGTMIKFLPVDIFRCITSNSMKESKCRLPFENICISFGDI